MSLAEVVEANLTELIPILSRTSEETIEGFYSRVLFYYLSADLNALSSLLNSHREKSSEEPEWKFARMLAILRMKIRSGEVLLKEVESLDENLAPQPIWKSEALFVKALAYEALQDHSKAFE